MAEVQNNGLEAGEKEVIPDYVIVDVRTPFVCFLHWLLVAAMIVLSVTGFYIGYPDLLVGQGEAWQTFMMAKVRFVHFISAAVLIITLMLRLYFSFSPGCRRDILDILPTPKNIWMALKLAWFYITMKGEHAHFRFINPIGGIAIFLMINFFIIEIATGFTLYFQQADVITWGWAITMTDQIEIWMGGMTKVRLYHHLIMWILITMVTIHIYMQIWKDIFFDDAGIVSIIAGYKVFHRDVVDHHVDRYKDRGIKQNDP